MDRTSSPTIKPNFRTIENIHNCKRYVCHHLFQLAAICPVTCSPDFYTIKLFYEPQNKLVEIKSFNHYLSGYKYIKLYSEDVANQILDDFVEFVNPRWAFLDLKANVRRGIYTNIRRYWGQNQGDDIERAVKGM